MRALVPAASRFAAAVRMRETAFARVRATGRILSLPAYRSRLEVYRAGRPHRP